jgi:hypothetical protein
VAKEAVKIPALGKRLNQKDVGDWRFVVDTLQWGNPRRHKRVFGHRSFLAGKKAKGVFALPSLAGTRGERNLERVVPGFPNRHLSISAARRVPAW